MKKAFYILVIITLTIQYSYAITFKNGVINADNFNCQPTYTQDPNIVLPHPSVNCTVETTRPWWLPYNRYFDTTLHLTPTELQQKVDTYKNIRWY